MIQDLPRTYQREQHPLIECSYTCDHCELGKRKQRLNQFPMRPKDPRHFTVPGAGPDDLSKVRLIILSDHSGHYESNEKNIHPMVDMSLQQNERVKGILKPRNAGAFLRMALNLMFGLDTYHDCWITNAVKCNPFDQKIIESRHIKPCVSQWLTSEFLVLQEHCPDAPLLVAGTQAFRACKLMFKQERKLLKEYGLNGCRRRGNITLGGRPAIFTENPSKIARAEPRIESSISVKDGVTTVDRNEWLYPPLPGSPVASFINDLKFLEPFLNG